MIPLQLRPAECFADLQAFLRDSGYTERAVCERLGLEAQHEILTRKAIEPVHEIRDAVDLLIRLFLSGEYVEETVLRRVLPAAALNAAHALGLLAGDASRPELWYAPVFLYPIGPLYIVSDRWTKPDKSPFTPPADIVYPAITKNTYRFLGMLPAEPCERFLDLCSGTGIAALTAASEYAARAWAIDVTERATHFANFNRLLNGLGNVAIHQGDLYEPVSDRTFDRIVVHPPYVPSTAKRWIFQDAGAEGEEITRRIVEALPRYLCAGGGFYCLALGADHAGHPFEERVRSWLGEHGSQFDILLAVVETYTTEQIASQPLLKGQIGYKEFRDRNQALSEGGAERFVYGFLIIKRFAEAKRLPFTVRRQVGARTRNAELEWALGWESEAAAPGFTARVMGAGLSLSPNLEMHVIHRPRQGSLSPSGFKLQTNHPFSMECEVHAWTAAMLAACEGAMTGSELYEHCRRQECIQASVPAEDFARFLGSLVSGGFLEMEGFRPPAAEE